MGTIPKELTEKLAAIGCAVIEVPASLVKELRENNDIIKLSPTQYLLCKRKTLIPRELYTELSDIVRDFSLLPEWGSEIKLLPCPFCGGINLNIIETWEPKPFINCAGCNTLTYADSLQEATDKWNTREISRQPFHKIFNIIQAWKK